MLFCSLPFLFGFLPAALLLCLAAPRRLQNAALLLCSLIFYGWGEPRALPLLVLTALWAWGFGLLLPGRPKLLPLAVCGALAPLLLFKYADFLLGALSLPGPGLALPAGISFYTFQALSYLLDVREGGALRSPADVGCYLSMFPQLIAGPIVRYREIAPALRGPRRPDLSGFGRFLIGLSKKLLLADTFGAVCTEGAPRSLLFAWLDAVCGLLQLYFDFSGYSDMAVGLGRMLGFSFPENFRYPLIAGSLREFWRRWHISLGGWFRDYVYFPLGGSRRHALRNLLTVWLLTGLWHGAGWTFLLWGLFFGVLIAAEHVLTVPPVLSRILTPLCLLSGFVLFRCASLPEAGVRLAALLGLPGLPGSDPLGRYLLRNNLVPLLLGALGATPLPARLGRRLRAARGGGALEGAFLCALLLLCTAGLVDGSFHPFLYFRF